MDLFTIESRSWDAAYPPATTEAAVQALEAGRIVFLPNLAFALQQPELKFLNPSTVHRSKNVSYNPATARVGGTAAAGDDLEQLRGLLSRFSGATRRLIAELFPFYGSGVRQGRTSLRPVEVAGRVSSWRADDTRLHVDTFPSTPTRGERILRVFSNVNHEGRPRVWKIGGPFEGVARRFKSTLRAPLPGTHAAMYALRITKSMRSPYDHYMLQLHDRMKADQEYQTQGDQFTHSFPAGSTWIAYTDQVPHAALSGIHQLEQTFYVSVASLRNQTTAPLRVLEGLFGRKLA
ncbi:MAG: Kdo hydroxylase family protein [Vicinamibacterales bacterium]